LMFYSYSIALMFSFLYSIALMFYSYSIALMFSFLYFMAVRDIFIFILYGCKRYFHFFL